MHGQHQNGVSLTIPKDPVDKHKIYTVRGKNTAIKKAPLFPSFPIVTKKEPTPNFCHCKPPQFSFCHIELTHFP